MQRKTKWQWIALVSFVIGVTSNILGWISLLQELQKEVNEQSPAAPQKEGE